MSVYCVLSGRGLCDELITRPKHRLIPSRLQILWKRKIIAPSVTASQPLVAPQALVSRGPLKFHRGGNQSLPEVMCWYTSEFQKFVHVYSRVSKVKQLHVRNCKNTIRNCIMIS